jgi:hypothetical protein
MEDHHPENVEDTLLHEEYQNGNSSVAEINDLASRIQHFNENYSHHADSQYASPYLTNDIVDLSAHDRESVIEESPNQRYAKVESVAR